MMNDINKVYHLPIRIYWENTDAGGRVYHTQYIQFAERGRTEYLRNILGLNQTDMRAKMGVIFVVKALTTEFKGYAQLDDEVVVHTRVESVKGAKITFAQDVVKEGKDIVSMQVVVVTVNVQGTPVRIPKYIIDKIH